MAQLPISRSPGSRIVLEVDQAHARQLLAAELVRVAEQLVAAADGEHHRAAARGGVERVALRGLHVVRDGDLVAILPAAHVDEVVRVRVEPLAERWRRHARSPMPRHSQRARSTAMLPRSA